MKTMTCRQLGGACDKQFDANSFDQIAGMSKQHGRAMFQKKDPEHLVAMNRMQSLMNRPEAMQAWLESKRKEFDALPEDK